MGRRCRNSSSRMNIPFFLDACALTAAFAEVVQPGAAYTACFVQINGINIGGKQGEGPFNAHPIRYLTHCKCGCLTGSLALDHIAAETLDTFLATFNDLVINSNIVTGFKLRELFFTCQLLVYILNCCIHDIQF